MPAEAFERHLVTRHLPNVQIKAHQPILPSAAAGDLLRAHSARPLLARARVWELRVWRNFLKFSGAQIGPNSRN